MSDDMTMDDVAKLLNDRGHNSISDWEVETVFGEQIVRCKNVYYTLTAFDARAVAREYLRRDGKLTEIGPATRKVIEATAAKLRREQREPKRFREVQGATSLSDKEVKAFLAEQGER